MDFVAIDTGIASDRVTFALSSGANISRNEAVGVLVSLFAAMTKHADDGRLSDVPDDVLEAWCNWTGRRGRIATIIRAQLCDTEGVVRAWDRRNGAMIRKAKQDRERKRNARAAGAERARNVHGQSTDNLRSGAGTVPDLTVPDTPKLQLPLVESRKPRETDPLVRKGKGAAAPRATWLTPIGAVWEQRYDKGSFDYGQAARTLAPLTTAGHTPEEIARRLAWYLDNRGSESTLGPEERRRRQFTPNLRDFRLRFGQFDPSALEAA